MSKLIRREVILLAIESTYGTNANPTAANDALLVENSSWSLEGLRMAERPAIRQSIGKLPSVYAGSLLTVSFDVEFKGSGAAGTPPEMGQALRACGLAESIVASTSVAYQPASTGHESATIYHYEDGSLYIVTGCRGTITGVTETGNIGKVSLSFTGHLLSKTDTSIVSPSYDSVVPAPAIGAVFNLGGANPIINAINFDLGNELVTPPSIAAADGYGEVLIAGRAVTGSIDPEAGLNSEKNYLNELQTNVTQALTLGPVGSTAGNIYTISMPAIKFTEMSPGDRDSLRTYELSFEAVETGTDDEITITFT